MVYENNLDKGTNAKPSAPDIHPMLFAQAYPTIEQKTTVSYPQCHNNPHAGDATPSIILNPNSNKADSNSSSDANARSNSSATGGRANSEATGGDSSSNSSAKTGDSRSTSQGGDGGSSNLYNSTSYRERTAPDVIPATVIPGAPASTEFEIIDGPRRYKERSNATTDTTNFGVSVGVPTVGVGLTFGSSRPAETQGVANTAQKENDAFYGVFFPGAVEAADPNLRQATSRLRQGVVQEAQAELARRAAEAAEKK